MRRVAVVDYGMCNLDSVRRALELAGARPYVTDDPADLDLADRVVLPGVGAFPDAMERLRARGLDTALRKLVLDDGMPFLGICLGMQLLATRGTEVRACDGLGWVAGAVERLRPGTGDERVPHIGWNEVRVAGRSELFAGIPEHADLYFVHSFHLVCDDPADVVATTPYCRGFAAAVQRRHVVGVQFHPEKSQGHGLRLLRNFLAIAPG